MADLTVGELTAAEEIRPADLFVLEQDGTAKSLSGQVLVSYLLSFIDGHGGIQRVAKTSTSGLVDTYTITYADASISTFTVTNGAKGDTGTAAHIYIKYSDSEPTQDSDMVEVPSNWIGIYSGTATSAPTAYTSYDWFEMKGDIGEPSQLLSSSVTYQQGVTSTVVPTGTWLTDPPAVQQGNYLWTRTILTFNRGNPVTMYSVARQGINGEGAPSDDTPLVATGNGSAGTSTAFSRSDHRHPTPIVCILFTNVSTTNVSVNDARITGIMRVIDMEITHPEVINGNIGWTTDNGSLALSIEGSIRGTTNIYVYCAVI